MHYLKCFQPRKFKICRYYIPIPNCLFPRKNHNSSTEQVSDLNSDARHLFDELPEFDVVSVSTLISQLGKQNRHREAIICFLRMLHMNIRPNEYTFGTVFHSSVVLKDFHFSRQVHAFAKKTNFNSNVFVGSAILDLYVKTSKVDDALKAFEDTDNPNVVSYSTLIHGHIKEGRFDEAVDIFRSMPKRNTVSWNTMISGCSQTGNNEEAVKFLVDMLREGVIPTQLTFPCAMTATANIGALSMGKSIHACAMKFLSKLNLVLENSLISFYAKCGSMEDSLLVFNKMHERTVISWNALICGYAQNGKGNHAIKMYEKMKLYGVRPNSITILGLLLACNHVGLVDEGYKYFNEYPSLLKAEHYACMVDLLSRSGRFQEVEKFLVDLPFDPGVGFWKTVLGGCRIHSNLDLGEFAAKKILELNPGDGSSYVMLCNAYLAAGKSENVVNMRRKMKEKGFSRIPGSSWIEVQSKVHVFVTGDKRHGFGDEIYKALSYLVDHLMTSQDVNYVEEFWV